MKLIIGFGNPEPQFAGTRHNIGFEVVNTFAAAHGLHWQIKDKFKAQIAQGKIGGRKIILAKPTTHYNLMGESAQAIKNFYKIDNSDVLLVHDELDLPLGWLRARYNGSDGGNNGVKSVIQHIGNGTPRLRIGIANEQRQAYTATDFVLGHLSLAERQALQPVVTHATALITEFINGDLVNTTIQTKK